MSVIESPSSRVRCPRAPGMRAAFRGGVVLAVVGGTVLVPSAAQAAENVSSYYRVYCNVHPDDATASSDHPEGLTYHGDRNDVTVSPTLHLLSGSTVAPQPSDASGEDCGVVGSTYTDRLTVGAGSSGLVAGDEVQVDVTVRLDAALAQTWGDDGDFTMITEYSADLSVVSLDDCSDEGGEVGTVCDTPVDFVDDHYHQVYGSTGYFGDPDGYVEASANRSYRFATNTGTGVDEYVDEDALLCDAYPCAPQQVHPDAGPEVFSGTATLVVGDRYDIAGSLSVFAYTYGNVDEVASVSVEDFRLDITSSSGVDLSYASEGGTPDTTPPVISGADDVTVTSADGAAVPVGFTVTATDEVDGDVPVTCTPASGSPFAVGTTTVTCEAADTAGNLGTASFTVTVEAGPTVRLGQALTALDVHDGIRKALQSKHDAAVAAFAAGRDDDGCGALQALSQQIAAQRGKKISTADAAGLTALVTAARAEQGC